MITQNLLNDVFALYLSGVAEMKNEHEIYNRDFDWGKQTIEFPTLSPTYAIIRDFDFDNNLIAEIPYVNGKAHGKFIEYNSDGTKFRERDYINGLKNGKDIYYHLNGNKMYEVDFKNDKEHGKNIGWSFDGKIIWEENWENGELIK